MIAALALPERVVVAAEKGDFRVAAAALAAAAAPPDRLINMIAPAVTGPRTSPLADTGTGAIAARVPPASPSWANGSRPTTTRAWACVIFPISLVMESRLRGRWAVYALDVVTKGASYGAPVAATPVPTAVAVAATGMALRRPRGSLAAGLLICSGGG